jgi:hypothetical protein
MEYEFKIVILAECNEYLKGEDLNILQSLFDQGWEFVSQIVQPVALAGSTHNTIKSAVGVVLKRIKTKKTQEDLLPFP